MSFRPKPWIGDVPRAQPSERVNKTVNYHWPSRSGSYFFRRAGRCGRRSEVIQRCLREPKLPARVEWVSRLREHAPTTLPYWSVDLRVAACCVGRFGCPRT